MEQTKDRKHYIDLMRGIAAVLVVVQHCFIIGTESRGGIYVSWFHNPVFFIASGILLQGSLERQKDAGLSKLFGKQLLSLFVPFVIWNILDALLCLAFHTPIYSLASNAVWFLAVLCFAHCAIIPVRKVTRKAVILLLFALLLAGMLASAFIASFLAKVFTFTCIVYLGFIIERFPLPKRTAIIVNLLLLGALAGITAYTIQRQYTVIDGITTGPRLIVNMLATILSASFTLFTVRNLYDLLAKIPLTPFFRLLGQYSMQLYLLPFLLCAIVRRFSDNPYLLFLVSIFGSLLLAIGIKGTIIEKILFRPAQLFTKRQPRS